MMDKKKNNILNLSLLLKYFEKLKEIIHKKFPDPKDIPIENIMDYNYILDYQHPPWVKLHFPLMLILYRTKAGKLRKSKKESIAFQNNMNVATQLVWTADDFGAYNRKNKHHGWREIVAAITISKDDERYQNIWTDKQPLTKYKNFEELARMQDPSDINLKALCEVLQQHYPCDSHGQLRML